MAYPTDRRYSKTHEWAKLEGGVATVGITAFAVEHLGDLVYVELPAAGKKVEKEKPFAEVESVKAVAEIYAPVAGTVSESNGTLKDATAALSSDPHGAGWISKIKVAAGTKLDHLMDAAAYEKHLASNPS